LKNNSILFILLSSIFRVSVVEKAQGQGTRGASRVITVLIYLSSTVSRNDDEIVLFQQPELNIRILR